MSQELQAQVAELLKGLLSAAQSGAAWTGEQIPLLVQEKILMGRVETTATFFVGLLMTLAVWPLVKFVAKAAHDIDKADYSDEPIYIAKMIGGGGAALIFAVVGLINTLGEFHNLALVWFAPRLYIIEWLKEVVK